MNLNTQEPQPEPSYRIVPLTQGQVAWVDPEDYEWAMRYNWHASWSPETKSYYAFRNVPKGEMKQIRTRIAMHRELMGAPVGRRVDHRDHNTLDNRRSNLRIATPQQNAQNSRKQDNNSSGYTGVYWLKRNKKWSARITINRQEQYLGLFDSAEEAAAARDALARSVHGEFFYADPTRADQPSSAPEIAQSARPQLSAQSTGDTSE